MALARPDRAVIDLSLDSDDDRPSPSAQAALLTRFSDSTDEFDEIYLSRSKKRRRLDDEPPAPAVDAAVSTQNNTTRTRDAVLATTALPARGEDIISSPPAVSLSRAAGSRRQRSVRSGMQPISVAEPDEPWAEDAAQKHLSATTVALLAEISGNAKTNPRDGASRSKQFKTGPISAGKESGPSIRPNPSYVSNEPATQDKEARRRAKEAELKRKRVAKEQKAKDRQDAADFAKANQPSRWDKKNSSASMILDVPSPLMESNAVKKAAEKFQELRVEVASIDRPISDTIIWRRRVDTTFNEELGHWEPTPEHIVEEPQVLCYIRGDEACRLLLGDGAIDKLDAYVAKVKDAFGSRRIILLFEGIDAALRKTRTSSNKAYRDAVRRGTAMPAATEAVPQDLNAMTEMAEDSLMHLQVAHQCGVLQTADDSETAEWLVAFTEQISLAPSRYVEPRSHRQFTDQWQG